LLIFAENKNRNNGFLLQTMIARFHSLLRMPQRYEGWLSFSGTIGEWIVEEAKLGRRFIGADKIAFENGSSRVKFRYAHPPSDPGEVVAIQDNYLATTTLYHPALKLPE
jgi:hypothetical protein